jgi:outer membrane protein TolC
MRQVASVVLAAALFGGSALVRQAQAQAVAPQVAAVPILTLDQALRQARLFSPQFQQAVAAAGVAHEARVQSRDALLPTVNYTTQYLYTQGNGTPSGRFIANNAVHEYVSEGNVHEDLYSSTLLGQLHRTRAGQLLADAQLRIASRGLRATVVQGYYGLLAARHHVATATTSLNEAENFLKISQELEKGGEVAHSDVLKAELQVDQRQRELADAKLQAEQARLSLGIVLFPTPEQPFHLKDDLAGIPSLPPLAQVKAMAGVRNPLIEAAQASLQQAHADVGIARGGFLPTLTFDYWYGIDAMHFALRDGRIPNLGYSAQATLLIPVWNWGATRSRVHQAQLQQHSAQVQLDFTRRQLAANLDSFYAEADTARRQLATLRHSLDLAQESLRLSVLRYRNGETNVLEVVSAQDALTLARNAWTDGEVRYRVALANLQTLTGAF